MWSQQAITSWSVMQCAIVQWHICITVFIHSRNLVLNWLLTFKDGGQTS